MLARLEETQEILVVDQEATPFIGVSGRQVDSIERGTELSILGERGPYTIVSWGGRNGYVPTDHLVSPSDFNAMTDQDDIEEPAETSRPSFNPFRLLPFVQRAA
jgi:hypothetical protein